MANGQLRYGIGFNVDKAGLNELKNSLTAISKMTTDQFLDINKGLNTDQAQKELNKVKTTVQSVQNAMSKSFNADLGTVNLTKFNSELSKSGLNLKQIYSDLSKTGITGEQAFRKIATQLTTQNTHLKESHRLLNEMATTMSNTIKWSVASSAVNTLSGSIQKAYSYVKDLDSSLNDIRIVTNKSAESMQKFAKQANDASKALGKSTTDYTEASLIYYQQGLSEEDVAARAETTLKAANVTAQSTDEVSEQLTAVWNGYKVSAEEAELYVDKLAAVAATTAADLEELSTGMSKVASAANSMGVDIDQLSAQLATIVSVTRQAPESVGTALKTIYARLGDLAVDGEDEFGVALGTVSKTMEEMGIQILDAQGNMRDMGDIITETAAKWDTWTEAQRQAAAVAMAGKRQYNNLIALFENWDMYESALNTSANAAGTLQKQQDIYMESTEAHLKTLRASAEDVYDSLFNAESFNNLLDALTSAVDLLGNFIDSIGGAGNLLLMLGGTMTRVFNKQIAGGIMTTVKNIQKMNENAQNVKALGDIYKDLNKIIEENGENIDDTTRKIIKMGESINSLEGKIDPEVLNGLRNYTKELEEATKKKEDFQKKKTMAQESLANMGSGDSEFADNDFWNDLREEGNKARKSNSSAKVSDLENYKKLSKALSDNKKELEKAKKDTNELTKAQLKLNEAFQKAQLTNLEEDIDAYLNILKDADKKMADFRISIATGYDDLAKHNMLSNETRTKLLNLASDYDKAVEEFEEGSDEALKAAIAMQKAYEEAADEIIRQFNQIESTAKDVAEGIEDAYENSAKEIENNFGKALKNAVTEENIQKMVDLAGSIQQVAFAIQSIAGLGDIWADDTLSSGEKISQTFSAIGSSVAMVAMNFGNLKAGAGLLSKGIIKVAAAFKGGTVAITGLGSALAALAAPIAIATAAIGALAAAIYIGVKAYNADADAAKEAD